MGEGGGRRERKKRKEGKKKDVEEREEKEEHLRDFKQRMEVDFQQIYLVDEDEENE